jgi:DNA topoisomerase-1
MLAQKLYEGIELGSEGSVGLITYMRTDSTRVSEAALAEVREFIGKQYGDRYLPEKAVHYRSKKDAQDAHEAIRPTEVVRTPESLAQYLNPEELKLYRLIWQRFVASQMTAAIFDQTTIDIQAGRFVFRATGSVQKFDGFLKLYQEGRDEKAEDDDEAELSLPLVEKGEVLVLNKITPEQHFTEPPPRYTEATLVKALEEKGIGRPSTYAAIMSTIQEREYVEKLQGRFHPTGLGKTVNDLLIDGGFDELFNESYTARMEEELDEIEEGKIEWTTALRDFYKKFEGDLDKFKVYVKDIKEKNVPTDEVCLKCSTPGMVQKWGRFGPYLKCLNCDATRDAEPPATDNGSGNGAEAASQTGEETEPETCELCGKPMQMKRGRFGPFLGCTGYPECRNIRKIGKTGVAAPPPVPLDEKCPVDGAQLVKRFGRFGEFISCSNYPKCKYIKQETVGVSCPRPGCKGEIVVKKSKRGKAFYGCSEYPNCNIVYWDKPVNETCPQCNAPFLLEKTTKKQGTFRYCANEECGYKSDASAEPIVKSEPSSSGRSLRT